MANTSTDQWRRLFEQAKTEFETERCRHVADTENLQQMITTLERSALVLGYDNDSVSLLIRGLYPSCKHVESFVAAITSISQYDPTGCLVLGRAPGCHTCNTCPSPLSVI